MHETLVLGMCILPMFAVFIAMKMAVLMLASEQEVEHVHDESLKEHVYLEGVYDDVDAEDEGY